VDLARFADRVATTVVDVRRGDDALGRLVGEEGVEHERPSAQTGSKSDGHRFCRGPADVSVRSLQL